MQRALEPDTERSVLAFVRQDSSLIRVGERLVGDSVRTTKTHNYRDTFE